MGNTPRGLASGQPAGISPSPAAFRPACRCALRACAAAWRRRSVAFAPADDDRSDDPRHREILGQGLGFGLSRVHVAAAVQVVVDPDGGADHPAVEEDGECRRFEVALAQLARGVSRSTAAPAAARRHRVDVDAEDVRRRADLVQRLRQFAVEGVEDVVLAAVGHEAGDAALARIVVDRLALEDGIVNARQRPQFLAGFLGGALLGVVRPRERGRHRLQVQAVVGSVGSFSAWPLNCCSRKAMPSKPLPPWL